jgi:hypothetical protein
MMAYVADQEVNRKRGSVFPALLPPTETPAKTLVMITAVPIIIGG